MEWAVGWILSFLAVFCGSLAICQNAALFSEICVQGADWEGEVDCWDLLFHQAIRNNCKLQPPQATQMDLVRCLPRNEKMNVLFGIQGFQDLPFGENKAHSLEKIFFCHLPVHFPD